MFYPAFKCADLQSFEKIRATLQNVGSPGMEHIEIRNVNGYYQPTPISKPRFVEWLYSRIFGKPEHQQLHTVTDFVVRFFEANREFASNEEGTRTLEHLKERFRNIHVKDKFDAILFKFNRPHYVALPSGQHMRTVLRGNTDTTDFTFMCQDGVVCAHQNVLKGMDLFQKVFSWTNRQRHLEFLTQANKKERDQEFDVEECDNFDLTMFPKEAVELFIDIIYDPKNERTVSVANFRHLIELADYLSHEPLQRVLALNAEKVHWYSQSVTIEFPQHILLHDQPQDLGANQATIQSLAKERDIKLQLDSFPEEALQAFSQLMEQGQADISNEQLLWILRLTHTLELPGVKQHCQKVLRERFAENHNLILEVLLHFYKHMPLQRDPNHHDPLEEFLIFEFLIRNNFTDPEKTPELFSLCNQKASENDPVFISFLGILYEGGCGTKKDLVKMKECYERSANMGYVHALIHLANCYRWGLGVAEDPAKACQLLEPVLKQNNPRAINAYATAKENLNAPVSEVITYYQKASDAGFDQATVHLGYYYLHGLGVPKDETRAFELSLKAADSFGPYVQKVVGDYYHFYGKRALGFHWYLKAAQQGYTTAQRKVAECFVHAKGVAKDDIQAFRWYEIAAKNGDAKAQSDFATIHYRGTLGIPINFQQAFHWYQKSAAQGDARGFHGLAVCYYNGEGVARNYQLAMENILKANEGQLKDQTIPVVHRMQIADNLQLITNNPF